jgi:hypothetical protein
MLHARTSPFPFPFFAGHKYLWADGAARRLRSSCLISRLQLGGDRRQEFVASIFRSSQASQKVSPCGGKQRLLRSLSSVFYSLSFSISLFYHLVSLSVVSPFFLSLSLFLYFIISLPRMSLYCLSLCRFLAFFLNFIILLPRVSLYCLSLFLSLSLLLYFIILLPRMSTNRNEPY